MRPAQLELTHTLMLAGSGLAFSTRVSAAQTGAPPTRALPDQHRLVGCAAHLAVGAAADLEQRQLVLQARDQRLQQQQVGSAQAATSGLTSTVPQVAQLQQYHKYRHCCSIKHSPLSQPYHKCRSHHGIACGRTGGPLRPPLSPLLLPGRPWPPMHVPAEHLQRCC